MFTIIIVNYYSTEDIRNLIYNFQKYSTIQFIIIDNSGEFNISAQRVKIIKGHGNIGFGPAVNLGVCHCETEAIVLMNPDIVYDDTIVDKLVELSEEASNLNAILAPIVINDGAKEFTTLISFNKLVPFKRIQCSPVQIKNTKICYVSGACMVMSKDVFLKIGGFDEKIFLYAEDLDFCLRASKQNILVRLRTDFVVKHKAGSSSKGVLGKFSRFINSARGHYYVLRKYRLNMILALISSLYLASGMSIGKK